VSHRLSSPAFWVTQHEKNDRLENLFHAAKIFSAQGPQTMFLDEVGGADVLA
jgi:hypothetical protein